VAARRYKYSRLIKTFEHLLALFGSGIPPSLDAFSKRGIVVVQVLPVIDIGISGLT
jgi:hypothetical protein